MECSLCARQSLSSWGMSGKKEPVPWSPCFRSQYKSLNVIGVTFNAKGKSRKKQAMGLSMLCRMGKAVHQTELQSEQMN